MVHCNHIHDNHHTGETGTRQIISSYLNDHNLLNAERYTTDETIPPYKSTSIQQDIIFKIKESIYINGKGESIYAVLFAF